MDPTNTTATFSNHSFTIEENIDTNTLVGTIIPTDESISIASYSITAGNQLNLFAIDNQGALTVIGHLDYELSSAHSLTFQARDNNQNAFDVDVTVNITDLPAPTNFEQVLAQRHRLGGSYRFEVGGLNFYALDSGSSIYTFSIVGNKQLPLTYPGSGEDEKFTILNMIYLNDRFLYTRISTTREKNINIDNVNGTFENFKNFLCAYSGRCE